MSITITDVVIAQGYSRFENPATYVLYKQSVDYLNIVNFIGINHDSNLTTDQIIQLKQYVQANIPNDNHLPIKYLVIILDEGADKDLLRSYTDQINQLWIVDIRERKLLVYENQATNFDGLYEVIERFMQGIYNEYDMNNDPNGSPNYKQDSMHKGTNNRRDLDIGLITLILILINAAAYIILAIGGDVYSPQYMFSHGASMWAAVIYEKEYYRLFTSMFMHFGISHLLNNMVSLWLWGSKLEQMLGKVRYAILYLASGLIGGLTSVFANMWRYNHLDESIIVSAGASGAIYGIMGGVLFGVLVDKNKRSFFSGKRIGLLLVISIFYMFTESGVDHFAHIGGFVGGFIICAIYFVANHLRGKKL